MPTMTTEITKATLRGLTNLGYVPQEMIEFLDGTSYQTGYSDSAERRFGNVALPKTHILAAALATKLAQTTRLNPDFVSSSTPTLTGVYIALTQHNVQATYKFSITLVSKPQNKVDGAVIEAGLMYTGFTATMSDGKITTSLGKPYYTLSTLGVPGVAGDLYVVDVITLPYLDDRTITVVNVLETS